jgi:RNA-directed DNA polymerase
MAKGGSEFAGKELKGQEAAGNTDARWPTPEQAEARVLGIQTKLHHWATDDPGRRFDDLFNLVGDPAFLGSTDVSVGAMTASM